MMRASILLAISSLALSCDTAPPRLAQTESAATISATTASPALTTAVRPAIRHAGYGSTSGMKQMRPEVLAKVLSNSYGVDEDTITDAYKIYLGGLDYDAVTERVTEATATMPLVMRMIASPVCDAVINGTSYTDANEAATKLYERLHSRPIDEDTLAEAKKLYVSADESADESGEGAKAVCVFFFLMEGSFLLY